MRNQSDNRSYNRNGRATRSYNERPSFEEQLRNENFERKRRAGENASPYSRWLERREQERNRYRQRKRREFPSRGNHPHQFHNENHFPDERHDNHLRERIFDDWRRSKHYHEHQDDNMSIRLRDDYYAVGFMNEDEDFPNDYYPEEIYGEEQDFQGRELKYKNPHQRYRSSNY